MDKIIIQGLQVKSLIGVYDWERVEQQSLLINLELSVDLSVAGASDQVDDTIDYADLASSIERRCSDSQFQLLEALAEHLCEHILQNPRVRQVVLGVTKPNILPQAQTVKVELCRENSQPL